MPRLMKPQPQIQAQAAAAEAPTIRKLLHRVEETAIALGVGRTTIFRLLRDGDLHAVKIHGRTLIPVTEEEACAARLMQGAKS